MWKTGDWVVGYLIENEILSFNISWIQVHMQIFSGCKWKGRTQTGFCFFVQDEKLIRKKFLRLI